MKLSTVLWFLSFLIGSFDFVRCTESHDAKNGVKSIDETVTDGLSIEIPSESAHFDKLIVSFGDKFTLGLLDLSPILSGYERSSLVQRARQDFHFMNSFFDFDGDEEALETSPEFVNGVIEAYEAGKDEEVEKLLSTGPLNASNFEILLWAAENGSADFVRFLIETCAIFEIKIGAAERETVIENAIYVAAKAGNFEVFKYLIDCDELKRYIFPYEYVRFLKYCLVQINYDHAPEIRDYLQMTFDDFWRHCTGIIRYSEEPVAEGNLTFYLAVVLLYATFENNAGVLKVLIHNLSIHKYFSPEAYKKVIGSCFFAIKRQKRKYKESFLYLREVFNHICAVGNANERVWNHLPKDESLSIEVHGEIVERALQDFLFLRSFYGAECSEELMRYDPQHLRNVLNLIYDGKAEEAKALITTGNRDLTFFVLLMKFCEKGSLEMTRFLIEDAKMLEIGVIAKVKEEYLISAIKAAAIAGHLNVLEYLIDGSLVTQYYRPAELEKAVNECYNAANAEVSDYLKRFINLSVIRFTDSPVPEPHSKIYLTALFLYAAFDNDIRNIKYLLDFVASKESFKASLIRSIIKQCLPIAVKLGYRQPFEFLCERLRSRIHPKPIKIHHI